MSGAAQTTEAPPLPGAVVLRATAVSKRFGAVTALRGVSVAFRAGEITALLGENGAGKSTLIKCMTGVHECDSGTLEFAGSAAAPRSPREAESLGVSTVFQEVNLIPHMTVEENICLGREPTNILGAIRWKQVRSRARAALARVGVTLDPGRELSSCSIAEQQLVAIARALDIRAQVLILDEPTSSLDRTEVRGLFDVLRRLRDDGLALVMVTHFLDQVWDIAARAVVLRDGQLVGDAKLTELTRSQLVSMMVGREIVKPAAAPAGRSAVSAPLLRAKGLSHAGALDGVDLEIGQGEVVGLAGLLGSGRSETARALFGAPPADSGEVHWKSARVKFASPRDAIAAGIGMSPEDRKADGLMLNLSVHENIAVARNAKRGSSRLTRDQSRELAKEFVRRLGIKTPSVDTPVGTLSGGNQQKVLLARWIAAGPELLIVDEPTRGIDIGAKADVLRELLAMRDSGLSVLFISSELEEVLAVSSRITVLRDRRSIANLAGDSLNASSVLGAITEDT